jgi:adenosylhomocysteine nucleosidase
MARDGGDGVSGAPSGPVVPGGPDAVAVGIVLALDIEADAFASRVSARVALRTADGLVMHTGLCGGRSVAWVVAGTGVERARRAAGLLVTGHRPRLLVTAGFAGGLDPRLPRGALVVTTRALRTGAPGHDLVDPLPEALPRTPIITVDTPLADPVAKRALGAETGAGLIDMESHAVAGVAATAGLCCAGLRVVSDAADDRLPAEVKALARPQSGWRRMGAAVGAVGRRPGAVLDLWRLWEHAVTDGRRLADGLERLCRAQPGA